MWELTVQTSRSYLNLISSLVRLGPKRKQERKTVILRCIIALAAPEKLSSQTGGATVP